MQSSFDVRSASFSPEQTAILSEAYRLALKGLEPHRRIPASTKSKLAKVVISLARQRLENYLPLNAEEIFEQASRFSACLQLTKT